MSLRVALIKNLVPSLPCNTKSSLSLRFIVVITHLGDKTLHNICVVRCVGKSQHDGMTVPSSPLCKCFSLHRRRDMASVMASRAIYKYYVLGVLTASFICSEGGTRCQVKCSFSLSISFRNPKIGRLRLCESRTHRVRAKSTQSSNNLVLLFNNSFTDELMPCPALA